LEEYCIFCVAPPKADFTLGRLEAAAPSNFAISGDWGRALPISRYLSANKAILIIWPQRFLASHRHCRYQRRSLENFKMKKVFFDTNFLLRFYLDDIPTQALKAKRMVQAAKKGEILLATDLIVICEMVWIMDSFDNLEKEVISVKITNLYRTPGVVVLNGDILPDALSMYITKNIDFTDAIVASAVNLTWLSSKTDMTFLLKKAESMRDSNVVSFSLARRFSKHSSINSSAPSVILFWIVE
jgi:predicted nucleic-acid-binding protein